ncbi:MAG: F0F1 ATP synthase subunit delta [Acetobacteraceae bacterium]|nr:F0F1 ATP synthase subunit delta [Acetobacteraceae bacterium]
MHLDWSTLALQTINVLVLVWLLRRFLFRPIVDIVAARRAAVEKTLADAAAAMAGLDARAADLAGREQAAQADATRIRAAAHEAAKADRDTLLQQAATDAAQARAEAEAATARARIAMQRDLERQAGELAVAVAMRLLQRIPAEAATGAFVAALEDMLTGLPDEQRAGLAEPGAELEVASAAALTPQARAHIAGRLQAVFGYAPALRFTVDPALIAGIELRGPHCTVRNTWRADLDRIAADLHLDSTHVEPALA